MNANELFRAGKLNEAINVLTSEVKQEPLDSRRRTFLFELLCFAGEWDRAEKQLDVLAQGGAEAELGSMFYHAALHAERERRRFFEGKEFLNNSETESSRAVPGVVNGTQCSQVSDADSRIGARLEVFAGGQYIWVPYCHIASIEMQAPRRVRDLLWAPAIIRNGPGFKGRDLGEVILPVLSPGTCGHPDDEVRLGRSTVWEEDGGVEVPFGQKMLLIDGEEVPWLELRSLQFSTAENVAAAS